MGAYERLRQWLTHQGFAVKRNCDGFAVRVARRHGSAVTLRVRLTVDGWVASGDRRSHVDRPLSESIAAFNDAERIISGADGDALDLRIAANLAAMPEDEVCDMAAWYRSQPALTLNDIGKPVASASGRGTWVPYPNLASLVAAKRVREAYIVEAARQQRKQGTVAHG